MTKLKEASKRYGLLAMANNLAILLAGAFSVWVTGSLWQDNLQILTAAVLISGGLAMWSFAGCQLVGFKEKREPLNLMGSLKALFYSKQLRGIAVMVVAYAVVINLAEVAWKDLLRTLHPTTTAYHEVVSWLQVVQGGIAIVLSLAFARLHGRFGWTFSALITPLVMLFFFVTFFALFFSPFQTEALIVGALLIVVSKGCKFSLFNSTKEMAFLPLSPQEKVQGKAVVDGLGNRVGKLGGSAVQQTLFLLLGSFTAAAPLSAGVGVILLTLWVVSLSQLKEPLNN